MVGRARHAPALPNVTELEIMRHYAHLASMNFGVDSGMYPLGSCTMKYNPRINEDACRLPGFAGIHPYQPEETVQGALELMVRLGRRARRDLGPAWRHASARGWRSRRADRAHGVPSGPHGAQATLAGRSSSPTRLTAPIPRVGHDVRLGDRHDSRATSAAWSTSTRSRRRWTTDVAAFMLTNPNTVGLFDPQILEITEAVHAVGAFAYCDGANLNAILGKARPGDMGFDAHAHQPAQDVLDPARRGRTRARARSA